MRPGLPDPLIELLGARWSMGAPLVGAAWFEARDIVAFALADGTLALAPARWEGAARLQPREGGGVELVPATGTPPPVSRVGVHAGPCADIVSAGADMVLSGGVDGRLATTGADGGVATVASFPGTPIERVAAGRGGALACAVGRRVHRFGSDAAALDLPGPVGALAFDPAGRQLAIAHPGGVTLWPAGGAATGRLLESGRSRALAWSSDGQHLASGLEDRTLRGWRLPAAAAIVMGDYPAPPLSVSYSAAGDRFATSGGPRVVCWQMDRSGDAAGRTECGVGSTVPVTQVACHPTRSLIAAGYENGAVLLCQPDSADILFVRAAGGGAIAALTWSATGAFLALGTASGEVGVVAFPENLFRDVRTETHAASVQGNPPR